MKRATFFQSVRARPFGGSLTQSQVDGLNAILDVWEHRYKARTSVPQLAYCLATVFHETARTIKPIREYGNTAYFTRMYDIAGSRPHVARALGNTMPGDGARYCGHGYVQMTGRANYAKASAKLGIDLVAHPELAMDPTVAARIMFEGMEEGWFTNVTLDKAIDDVVDGDEHADFLRGRRIINGTDRDTLIAGYADAFLKALIAAGDDQQAAAAPLPPPPDVPKPEPRPVQRPWWKRLFG